MSGEAWRPLWPTWPAPRGSRPGRRSSKSGASISNRSETGVSSHPILGRDIAGEIGNERFRQLHDVYRANRLALDGYQPRTYAGRIVLIRAESSQSAFENDTTRAWADLAVGGVTTYHIPGDHYTILQRPAVERLAEILTGEIEGLNGPKGKIHPR